MVEPTIRKSKRAEALEFAKAVRNDLHAGTRSLELLLLQCRTICKYLDRLEVNEWIDLELNGYYSKWSNLKDFMKNIPAYRKVSPILYDRRGQPLQTPYGLVEPFTSMMGLGEPIAQIENSKVFSVTSGQVLDALNDHLNKLLEKNGNSQRNIVYYAQYADNHLKNIVSGLRNRIGDFVDEVILELEYGEIPEEIFETLRSEVDQKLAKLSPQAIEKLKNAYEKIGSSGSSEDWSHVASTCRRVIKDVADVVFPAQDTPQKGKDGKEHVVDDTHVINRIIAGINADLGKGKNRIFTESMIKYVDNFLKGIQEYASKGDHATFQKTDAVRCLIYTYMLLGDILNYHVDKDERNVGEQKSTEEEPDITIVNFHPEPTANKTLKLFPNLRNDGISARNIKIHYKVFVKILTLKEIVAKQREIKRAVIEVPGTVRHGDSVNLNDGKESSGILFPNTDGPKSVILWLSYRYGDNSEGEAIVDLRYEGKQPTTKHPIRYTRSDIGDLVGASPTKPDPHLGKPELELGTYAPLDTSGDKLKLVPNFKNRGQQPASNVNIHYRVFDKIVDVSEIVGLENEIKKTIIRVPGSISTGMTVNLAALGIENRTIQWERRDRTKPYSVALWYTYEYLDSFNDEVLFHINYADHLLKTRVVTYTSKEIREEQAKLG